MTRGKVQLIGPKSPKPRAGTGLDRVCVAPQWWLQTIAEVNENNANSRGVAPNSGPYAQAVPKALPTIFKDLIFTFLFT